MKNTKKLNTILIIFTSILLITIISFSFAHFNTRISNAETSTTLSSGSGIMEITYSSGEVINAPNIFPDSNPFITKEFTVSGKNSNPTENMHYHLVLVLDENTFRSSALTYTLESTNQNNNGYTVPDKITQTGLKTGKREIFLGNGMFTSTNNESKVHSYTLKLYFPKIEHFEHGIDQGKTFKAHIETREGEIYPGYNEEKGVNHPVLFTGMTPIKWDENNKEINTTADDPDWYDYDEKKWANAKSLDGSYWVWIPRYAYKIETCYHTSGEDCLALTGKEAGDIDVKFLKSTTNLTDDNTTIESTGYEAHVKDTSIHHFLHPAFQFNGDELGFWMAKFEPSVADQNSSCYINSSTSNCNTTNLIVAIIPNANAWRYIDNYNAYNISTSLKNKSSIYGWNHNLLDSHMITNQEWGAVAYLSKSKYGAYIEEVWNNAYTGYITGCSGPNVNGNSYNECIKYNTINGQKASTTHNIYGVYDMSGGAQERAMGNYNNLVGMSNLNLQSIEAKYISKYFTDEAKMLNKIGMDYDESVYGDAIFETSFAASRYDGENWIGTGNSAWYLDRPFLSTISSPWIARGGDYGYGTTGGTYHFRSNSGSASISHTFRPILTPL